MDEMNKKALDFVVKHYQEGKLDTQKAIKTFRRLTGEVAPVIPPRRYIAIAASLLVLLGVTIGWLMMGKEDGTLVASGNQSKTCILPDGSKVTLAPHSSISYFYKEMKQGERSVQLAGKAYFEVVHDPNHPFDVFGDISHVRVLGTVFQVDESVGGSAYVKLFLGKVLFSAKHSPKGVILTSGMSARLDSNDSVPRIVSNSNDILSQKVFHFNNTPIREVLRQLSAYYHVTLYASDDKKSVSGEFEAGDINQLISMLESMLDITITIKR